MNNPYVSVIIPAYNAIEYLERTVQSVISQHFSKWELLIVNDGSKDETLKLAHDLAKDDPRILVFDKPNGGVSSARNLGISHSTGQLLAFLDADDLWDTEFLQACIDKFQTNNAYGLVHTDVKVINQNDELTGETKNGKEGWLLDQLLLWEEYIMAPPSGILVKREVIEQIGGFDENLSNNADQDFYFRCAAQFSIGRVSAPLLSYRVHENNMHNNITVLERDTLIVYKKAVQLNLFRNERIKRKAKANAYSIIGACWIGDGSKKLRGLMFLIRAFITYPLIIKKWMLKK